MATDLGSKNGVVEVTDGPRRITLPAVVAAIRSRAFAAAARDECGV